MLLITDNLWKKVYVKPLIKVQIRIIINIEDDGPGISEDQYKNVIKPFF